jgi:DNA-binding PadR family transcriptional regulator
MKRSREPSPQTISVLRAFAGDQRRWRYGYDLCQETGLKAGTIYPILMRLADQGLLETVWEKAPPPGRPPRHMYRLSAAGRTFAGQFSEKFRRVATTKALQHWHRLEGAR